MICLVSLSFSLSFFVSSCFFFLFRNNQHPEPNTYCFGREQFDIATVLSVYEVLRDEYQREIGFISIKGQSCVSSLPRRGDEARRADSEGGREHIYSLCLLFASLHCFLMTAPNCFIVSPWCVAGASQSGCLSEEAISQVLLVQLELICAALFPSSMPRPFLFS